MSLVVAASAGLVVGGPALAAVIAAAILLIRHRRRRPEGPPLRSLLLLLIVELRAGRSVLASLLEASRALPDVPSLATVARVASVAGLGEAVDVAPTQLRPVISQLARCQRSGAPAAGAVRSILDADIAAERSRRIERARGLPVRLMIPIALLVLPGMVLLLYAPGLFTLWQDVTLPFS